MYTDLCLKFTSEQDAQAVLFSKVAIAWDTTDPEAPIETEWEDRANYANIDTIGTIYKPTGVMLKDSDGMNYPEPVAVDGWHVNVRLADGEDGDVLSAYAVTPATPMRVWG